MTQLSTYSWVCAGLLGASLITAPVAFAQTQARYEVSVTNLTNHQPLSPLAAVIHTMGYHPMQVGMPASVGLEKLAEGGETGDFLAEARAQTGIVHQTKAGNAPIAPGETATLVLEINAKMEMPRLSLATMLVNTNDAFMAVNAHALADLMVGDSMKFMTIAYDAGTEANTESAGTLPGPVDSGEGYNVERESRDQVTAHPGVVTRDDGLADSVLDESHRFLNPVAQVRVTRLADRVIQTQLTFTNLQAQYNPGDRVLIELEETTSIRETAADLWVALLMPDSNLLFFTEAGLTFTQMPFKTDVMPAMRNHAVFDFMLPTGLGGYYTLFAFYGHTVDDTWQIESEIAQRGLRLMDQ